MKTFSIADTELEKAEKFIDAHEAKHGRCRAAAGGRYAYEFTPTGIGTCVVIKCACGVNENVTDFDNW
jgi:hypothetical protein